MQYKDDMGSFITQWQYVKVNKNYYQKKMYDLGNALQYDSTCKSAYFIILAVVHVLHNNSTAIGTAENISKAQIENGIAQLNAFFN